MTSPAASRSRLLALLLVVVVSLVGAACGGSDDTGQDDTGDTASTADDGTGQTREDNGGGGGRNDSGDSGAVVTPLKIPAITQKQGQPIGEIRGEIRAEFIEACGGTGLCVTLREVDENGQRVTDDCLFQRVEPPAGTEVNRGSIVRLIVRCDEEDDEENGTTTTTQSSAGS